MIDVITLRLLSALLIQLYDSYFKSILFDAHGGYMIFYLYFNTQAYGCQ